jgi:hypothetical protein
VWHYSRRLTPRVGISDVARGSSGGDPVNAGGGLLKSNFMRAMFDVIGDIHGEADALRRILTKLDYFQNENGTYHHRSRKAVFVGDFIDRGPDQREVISIVRKMVAEGAAFAVMGNHELNAIAYSTPSEDGYFRLHNEKNRRQHAAFLAQIGEGSTDYFEAITWFKTLPLWFESGGLRVVHACWHQSSMERLVETGTISPSGRVSNDQAWLKLMRRGSPEEFAVDVLLKGPELELPHGRTFRDKEGHERRHVRQRWWDADAKSFRDAAIRMDDDIGELPDEPIPDTYRYSAETPVIVGHYWMTGQPFIAHPFATCVDFSVAKSGCLVGYRWSGEKNLTIDNLVSVPSVEA